MEHAASGTKLASRITAMMEDVHPRKELDRGASIAITMTIVKVVYVSAPPVMTASFANTGAGMI
jgi:hypothetical protein